MSEQARGEGVAFSSSRAPLSRSFAVCANQRLTTAKLNPAPHRSIWDVAVKRNGLTTSCVLLGSVLLADALLFPGGGRQQQQQQQQQQIQQQQIEQQQQIQQQPAVAVHALPSQQQQQHKHQEA